MSDYGFHFEDNGLNRRRGISSPEEELFNSCDVAEAVVRELAQNSLDAKSASSDGPVRMVFELRTVPTELIPDYENLRKHIISADECNRNDEQNDRLDKAVQAINGKTIQVLRIGDYNTTGLTGTESMYENNALSALTFGSGISVGKTGDGGSYGIGKAVGIRSSSIRTEFWVTRTEAKDSETVFTGYCQLATHLDPDDESGKKLLSADGIFTDRVRAEDLHYQRGRDSIAGFPDRTQPGTDVYIIGYRDDDPELENIKRALITNFMVAIDRGKLIAIGECDGQGGWELNSDTLPKSLSNEGQQAYYDALREDPVVIDDKDLGEVKLYINIDNTLSKKYDTMVMRSPLMKVTTWPHRSITAHYAAILECSDEKGNRLLRAMEPVSHDNWDGKRTAKGETIIKRLKRTVREELHKRIGSTVGDEITIDELNRLLPQGLNPVKPVDVRVRNGSMVDPGLEGDGDSETATVHGKSADAIPVTRKTPKFVPITQYRTAVAHDEGDPIIKGRDRGGTGTRGSHTAGIPGHGSPGDGNSLIQGSEISLKALYQGDGAYLLILRSSEEKTVSGALLLTATFEGVVDPNYRPIVSAEDVTKGNPVTLSVSNGLITGVMIRRGKPTRLRVTVQNKRKMQLAVI